MLVRQGECARCGLCCWDFKASNPTSKDHTNRCEHLADDMKTCLIWERLKELRPECCGENFPKVHCVVDLPETCGFWWEDEETGLVIRPGVIDRESFLKCEELKRFVEA